LSESAAPADAAVHVWIARESLADDPAVVARIATLLSPDERDRQARLTAATPRRLDLIARGLQRRMLSRLAPAVAPDQWRFVRGDTGRPSLAAPFDATGLHFNLAHTPGLVVMAAGRVPDIGIDVEGLDKRVNLDVARRYFSEAETEALLAMPPEQRPMRFLRLWTLKESYLKATGAGVAGGLARTSFEIDGDAVRLRRADDPHAPRWVFAERRPPGYLVALAYRALSAASGLAVTWDEIGAADF
jgi:4'-phosphopantetheinyl transferase